MPFNPRWIVGKTIERVELNPFDDGRDGTAHRPVIFFTDGSMIFFNTEETEHDSGTDITYVPVEKRRRSK